jgi:hypothetical protein
LRIACVVCNNSQPITSDIKTGETFKCSGCDGKGVHEITECPDDYVTFDVIEAIKYTRLFEKNILPMAGGALDQLYNFLEAADFILDEIAYCKREANKK